LNTKLEELVLSHKGLYPTYSGKLVSKNLQTHVVVSYKLPPLEHHGGTRYAHPIGEGSNLERQQVMKQVE
jgi:hypothetical protein